jgi:naphthalene 1,2-dioxygenase ferredoxin reductase component
MAEPSSQALRVLVQPLNRVVRAEPGANLLEALLAANIPVSYSCKAGRCGTCRCRIVGGEVLDHGRQSPRPMDNDEDVVLACQTYLADSCTIEIPEPDEIVTHPARVVRATVVRNDKLTHDVQHLVLRPAKPIEYSPGQYFQIEFGPGLSRPYSMANLSTEAESEMHIRVVPNGRVSGFIAEHLQPGASAKMTGPLGTSYLRKQHVGPILCVAGGTGLAPILAIIRGAIADRLKNPIHLYFGVRSPADLYGKDWLDALALQHGRLTVHTVFASGGNAHRQRTGLVTQAIESDLKDLAGWCAYICGSPPMVEAVTLLVKRLGIDRRRIYADAFYPQSS